MTYSRIEPSFATATGDVFAAAPAQAPATTAGATTLGAAWAGASVAALLLMAPSLVTRLFDRAPTPQPMSSLAPTAPLARHVAPALPDVAATGALPATSASTAEGVVTKPLGFTLLLGEASSAETLWGWWRILQQRHKSSVGGLVASVIQAEGTPVRHRLTAGPFENAAAAAELCGKWRADGTSCQVARPDGSKL
ncbi:hypothetical protein GCM10007036_40350 [Alsobacter metallidurans]|uniref:SPOR domain-containing protein n=1 Tax=Alsobacter metallidurans TaxID=340221 RepID=A0A917IB57_9HYPH|nr:hypothetical protein [Alsobacter metallidurans]GGH30025.1 hypothetical protein GCM10007036_40350 [Alsobacter metallidurans]